MSESLPVGLFCFFLCLLNLLAVCKGGLLSTVGSASNCRSMDGKFDSQLSHVTFMEINHEIIPCQSAPSADSRRVVVSYLQKYVHKVLVNHLED